MKTTVSILAVAVILALAVAVSSAASPVVIPKGTDITLVFDQPLSSKTAKVGQTVRLHVANNVLMRDKVLIKAGTPVTGVISKVDKRKPYGINAKIRIAFNPVETTYGTYVPIQARSHGKLVGGEKSGEAAGATIGGAVIAGPVGLIGGYFIHGKSVNIQPGQTIETEVPANTVVS